jgi:hypothetical protein
MQREALAIIVVSTWVGCSSRSAPSELPDQAATGPRAPVDGASHPPPDGGPETGAGEEERWSCFSDEDGRKFCQTVNPAGGLPAGGRNWRCNARLVPTSERGWDTEQVVWVCFGESDPLGTPEASTGWACAPVAHLGSRLLRCQKPDGPEDVPPGGVNSYWCGRERAVPQPACHACAKGNAVGGTQCELVQHPPGGLCIPGQRQWCDGPVYDGPAQQLCYAASGQDPGPGEFGPCQELAAPFQPNTLCACYHFFFDHTCCERLDCVVPRFVDGKPGQVCPPSPGQLCDYCNPTTPECTEAGARCLVTNAHETFCGQRCSPSEPCPSNFMCVEVKVSGGVTSQQCVSQDLSCYE